MKEISGKELLLVTGGISDGEAVSDGETKRKSNGKCGYWGTSHAFTDDSSLGGCAKSVCSQGAIGFTWDAGTWGVAIRCK